ncbi:NAD(+) diphosphatase [Glycomyces xiaoerkulensis]|uniref:NAD(+) diphosphatase n=1 Tax=Glycomyces xiaoerkulensis TaxID=2038139 RepID=UPI000C264532|nr:NAD(+) diphosphatase [Glycomyces xiaoerkulensis]
MKRPPLAIDALDRCAERRGDDDWLAEAWERAQVVVCDPETERLRADEEGLHYFDADTAPQGRRIYLGGEDPPVFAVLADAADGLHSRRLGADWDRRDLAIAVQSTAMMHWHRTYRFHPTTGEELVPGQAGWELAGERGRTVFPRTDPAVIVLIDDGADRVLLAQHRRYGTPRGSSPRQASTRQGRYACIAGFVEPGESAEAAVHREVAEETGLALGSLDYVSSQPWPYPRSLMLAFRATADPGQELELQDDEIADARWFTRDQVRRMWVDGDWSGFSAVRISVARFLIERWLDGS